jgi:hypothetical protein
MKTLQKKVFSVNFVNFRLKSLMWLLLLRRPVFQDPYHVLSLSSLYRLTQALTVFFTSKIIEIIFSPSVRIYHHLRGGLPPGSALRPPQQLDGDPPGRSGIQIRSFWFSSYSDSHY